MALFKLGAFAQSISGKAGNSVFRSTRSGTVVTDHVIPTNPDTAAQQDVRGYFRKATTKFATFSASVKTSWANYAKNQFTTSKAGKRRSKTAINVYAGLGSKILQVNPTATLPEAVPATPFEGDSITLLVEAESPGTLTFTASGPNASGVTTELLIQPLVSPTRKPLKGAYRTATFFTFTSGTLTKNVTVPPGYYAAGYRFVRTATGQDSQMVQLPVTTVSLAVETGKTKKAA